MPETTSKNDSYKCHTINSLCTQTIDSVTLVGVLFPSVYMARVLFPSGTNDRVFLCLSVLILVILNC